MDVHVRTLRSFLAVVEHGTFTDAAIALGVSQPAVSRAVATLESAVGTQLIVRGRTGVTLTEPGRRAHAIAVRLIADAERLAQVGRAPSVVRLGYAWAGLGRPTGSVLQRWQDTHPDVDLQLVNTTSATAGVVEGRADVALVRTITNDARLASSVVGHERRYGAVPRSDPLARRRVLRLSDFEGRRVAIDPDIGTTTPTLWSSSDSAPKTHKVHGIEEWLHAVVTGRALGLTTEAVVWQFPHNDVRYRPVADVADIELRLVWSRSAPPPLLDDLITLLRAELSGHG